MSAILRINAHYPLMSRNSLDYMEGNIYQAGRVAGSKDGSSAGINHCVKGNNLVTELLLEGRAAFACTVTAACCAYREVFVSEHALKRADNSVTYQQEIVCDKNKIGHPVVFHPHVIYTGEPVLFTADTDHGLDKMWINRPFELPLAAVLAAGRFFGPGDVTRSILRLKKDNDNELPEGCFEVGPVREEGFYFYVLVSSDLYESLHHRDGTLQHRRSIYSAAFAQGLEILKEDKEYHDPKAWKEYLNLRRLHEKFQEKNLRAWYEDGFNANRAVAAFYPHKLNTGSDSSESWGR